MKLCIALVILLAPAIACAQSDVARARALFEQGIAAGEAGNWEEAAERFRQSRAIVDRPSTIYNLAIAYEELERWDEAQATIDAYFAAAPEDDPRRLQAEALRGRLALRAREAPRQQTEPAQIEPQPAPPAPATGDDATPWALLGVGGALAAAGVVLAIVGQLDYDTVSHATDASSWEAYRDAWNRAPILVGVGWAAIGVGVGLAAIGLVLAATSGGGESASARLELAPGGLRLRGRF